MTVDLSTTASGADRLAALRRAALLDTPAEEAFDRLTRLASTILGAPVALVSLVDEDRQFFKSCVGLPEPWASRRETPLSHSFCQHAVASGRPLVIEDAREHPLVRGNPAIGDLDVVAYAGIPLVTSDGHALGSFCVIDTEPRAWTEREITVLADLAASVVTEIELRGQVAERRRAEEARARLLAQARAAEARYRGLFEGVADAILVADAAGRYLDANRAATELLGYAREEIRQLGVADVVAAGPDWAAAEYERFLDEGSWRGELELRRKDGSSVPVEARATAVTLPAGTIYLSALRDISERRALERMQRNFMAMVSHELRTPLTSIKGFAQISLRRGDEDGQLVEAILDQANRLQRLTDDLLEASRLEAGRLELRPVRLDLVPLVRRCVEQARALHEGYILHLVAPGRPLEGSWDPDRVAQVLENILGNAIKYSPDGTEVAVRVDDLGEEARVSVADRGPGIAPEELPRLFERFYRTRDAAARQVRGLGLGLHIARSLVEAHGGRIAAESEGRGRGTTVSFTLPYRPPPAEAAGARTA